MGDSEKFALTLMLFVGGGAALFLALRPSRSSAAAGSGGGGGAALPAEFGAEGLEAELPSRARPRPNRLGATEGDMAMTSLADYADGGDIVSGDAPIAMQRPAARDGSEREAPRYHGQERGAQAECIRQCQGKKRAGQRRRCERACKRASAAASGDGFAEWVAAWG